MVNRLYLQYNYDSSNLSFSKGRYTDNFGGLIFLLFHYFDILAT